MTFIGPIFLFTKNAFLIDLLNSLLDNKASQSYQTLGCWIFFAKSNELCMHIWWFPASWTFSLLLKHSTAHYCYFFFTPSTLEVRFQVTLLSSLEDVVSDSCLLSAKGCFSIVPYLKELLRQGQWDLHNEHQETFVFYHIFCAIIS